jgi:hypothetical protein
MVVNSTGVLFAKAYFIAYVLQQTQSNSEIHFKMQCNVRWEVYLGFKRSRAESREQRK